MVGPVHHVLRGIQTPIAHDEALRVVFVVAGAQVHRVANNQRRGIGREAALDDGIARQRGQTGAITGGDEGGLANLQLDRRRATGRAHGEGARTSNDKSGK